MKHIQ